jgi:hypothetical protein
MHSLLDSILDCESARIFRKVLYVVDGADDINEQIGRHRAEDEHVFPSDF